MLNDTSPTYRLRQHDDKQQITRHAAITSAADVMAAMRGVQAMLRAQVHQEHRHHQLQQRGDEADDTFDVLFNAILTSGVPAEDVLETMRFRLLRAHDPDAQVVPARQSLLSEAVVQELIVAALQHILTARVLQLADVSNGNEIQSDVFRLSDRGSTHRERNGAYSNTLLPATKRVEALKVSLRQASKDLDKIIAVLLHRHIPLTTLEHAKQIYLSALERWVRATGFTDRVLGGWKGPSMQQDPRPAFRSRSFSSSRSSSISPPPSSPPPLARGIKGRAPFTPSPRRTSSSSLSSSRVVVAHTSTPPPKQNNRNASNLSASRRSSSSSSSRVASRTPKQTNNNSANRSTSRRSSRRSLSGDSSPPASATKQVASRLKAHRSKVLKDRNDKELLEIQVTELRRALQAAQSERDELREKSRSESQRLAKVVEMIRQRSLEIEACAKATSELKSREIQQLRWEVDGWQTVALETIGGGSTLNDETDQEQRVGGFLLQPPSEATLRSWLSNTICADSSNSTNGHLGGREGGEGNSPGRDAVMARVVETISRARTWSAQARESQIDNSIRTVFYLMQRELVQVPGLRTVCSECMYDSSEKDPRSNLMRMCVAAANNNIACRNCASLKDHGQESINSQRHVTHELSLLLSRLHRTDDDMNDTMEMAVHALADAS